MTETIDEQRLQALQQKVMGDVAGAMGVFLAYLGDQAGIYDAMDGAGALTREELAARTGLNSKYLREWLGSNVAGGYIDYDPASERYTLSPEQALIFGREGQPYCMQGFFEAIIGQFGTHEEARDTFLSGTGRPWSAQSSCCFCATDRFFKPGYAANLFDSWIPAIDGLEERLQAGARVADIACGLGSATIMLARRFPNCQVLGFDFHEPSIEIARERAAAAGVDNVSFHVSKSGDFAGEGFDLACIFDALHDMGDPVGAARHIRETLKPDGTLMIVEPMAGDSLEDNCHPLGQIYYGFSTTVCTPCSLSQEVGLGLGTQAGERRLREVLNEAGFSHVRRAAETPANMVLEVRA
jgi:SAM-dependent methyltransferase